MRKYSQFNPSFAQSCLKSMKRHHEYLTEELVVVSLADENLTNNTRKAVATALDNTERQIGCFLLGKPKEPVPSPTCDNFWENVKDGEEMNTLSKLIGPRSWSIPNMLELSVAEMSWLKQDVNDWKLFTGYKKFYKLANSLEYPERIQRGLEWTQFLKRLLVL